MNYFKNAKWIWKNSTYKNDEYIEFIDEISINNLAEPVYLNISVDTQYAVYINEKLATFGQYADYPYYKVFDNINISKFLNKGTNKITIIVWYFGAASQTYYVSNPGLIYSINQGENELTYSSVNTLSKYSENYKNHYEKLITKQIGFSFLYNADVCLKNDFSNSVIVDKTYSLNIRSNKKLVLEDRKEIKVVSLENSFVIDMQEETCGFLDLEINAPKGTHLLITNGEYLREGHVVRSPQDIMDYSYEYICKEGLNKYINPFRRLGGRYIEILPSNPIEIIYAGIRPTNYPVMLHVSEQIKGDRRRVYKTAANTLLCCMHEHYEDCPWREQALYTMDSRNEMLCSYIAFQNYEFARSNLVLISKGLRDDNLFALCYPATLDSPIPFFSLIYPIEVYEYIAYSKDKTILDEVFPSIEKMMNNFIEHVDSKNLIKNWPTPEYWNFYEWTTGSIINDGNQYDALLSITFLYSLSYYKKLASMANKEVNFDDSLMRQAVIDNFFNEKRGLFSLSSNNSNSSMLLNSMAYLAGVGDKIDFKKLVDGFDQEPITLSMSTFFYDALLKKSHKYADFILNDIDRKYFYMLNKGATSFWETLKGSEDIGGSGSLCHGWSALPIYYYDLLIKK